MPNDMKSWIWWIFSVIVIALAINLVSSYLKSYLDIFIGKFSDKRKLKNEQELIAINRFVEKIMDGTICLPAIITNLRTYQWPAPQKLIHIES